MIIRVEKRQLLNAIGTPYVQDKRLSAGAQDILKYFAKQPNDWEIDTSDITLWSTAGRKFVRFLRELEQYSYVEKNRTDCVATVYDYPGKGKPRIDYKKYLLSPEWGEKRDIKLSACGHRCQLCNSDGVMNVHHRTYENLGRELDADLIVLCKGCHAKFHNKIK